jgi:hypothetical protein
VIAAHHLEAMEPQEVRLYVEHRLKCVGWAGNPAFDEEVFDGLYAASQGVPRRINQICNRLMLLGAVDRRDRIDQAMLAQVLDEFEHDGALQLKRPEAPLAPEFPAAEPTPHAAGVVSHPDTVTLTLAQVERLLADRDAQIAELQHAVIELAGERDQSRNSDSRQAAALAALEAKFASLESRMIEHEGTIRRTLSMLIEWVEADGAPRAAA